MTHNREHFVFLVDWLQFTLKETPLKQVYDLIGIPESDFKDMPTGMYSYKSRKACGSIWIMYDGRHDMGIHIQMSGQGCREYESHYTVPWEVLFDRLQEANADYSRLDLSIDEFRYNNEKPTFTIRQLIRLAKQGRVRTKFKSGKRVESFNFGDGTSTGDTLYAGSPLSDVQMRFYEKNKERENEGKQLEEHLTTWNRTEIQLCDRRAHNAIQACLAGLIADHLINGILRNYINFCEKSSDTNKARWPVAKFWLDFLGAAEKLRLAEKAPDKTIESKQRWLEKQVRPTFAEVWVAEGSPGEDWFIDLLNDGMERMSESQWLRAEMYQEMQEKEKSIMNELRESRRALARSVFNEKIRQVYQGQHEKEAAATAPSPELSNLV